jgi:hypothetical protein
MTTIPRPQLRSRDYLTWLNLALVLLLIALVAATCDPPGL